MLLKLKHNLFFIISLMMGIFSCVSATCGTYVMSGAVSQYGFRWDIYTVAEKDTAAAAGRTFGRAWAASGPRLAAYWPRWAAAADRT